MAPPGPPLYAYTDTSQLGNRPGVPGFTDMTDGWIIPDFPGTGTFSTAEFVFALKQNSQGVSTEKKVTAVKALNLAVGLSTTLENTDNDVDYKPPIGKTARAIVKIDVGNITDGIFQVRASDTPDTNNGTILDTWSVAVAGKSWTSKILEIPAGKYLTVTHSTGIGNSTSFEAWIAEEI